MIGKFFKISDRVLTLFEDWTLFLTVMVALVALFVNVVLRYGFNSTLPWAEELVREVIIYTTFIGCSAAVKKRSMIKIDASVQIFPKLKVPLTFFSNLVVLCFALIVLYYGWNIAALQIQTEQKTIIMQIPLFYIFAILPLMGITMTLRVCQVMYEDIVSLLENEPQS